MSFEVERFEWSSEERLELAGRWYEVRGLRFLRPTLDVEVDGQPRRLLALLEHKPWAAEEGDDWLAAFAWQGERAAVGEARLTVSPDITVELEPPTLPGGRTPKRRRTRPDPRVRQLEGERAALQTDLAAAAERVERLEAALAKERERFDADRDSASAAQQRLEDERDRALAERDAAIGERDAVTGARDTAIADRDKAMAERESAVAERDAATGKLAGTERDRDAAYAARDKAREERNAWLSRARDAAAQRDAALVARDSASAERDRAASARDAAVAERDEAKASAAPTLARPVITAAESSGPILAGWPARIAAVLALLVLIALVILLIGWAT